jgi:hypothetical protein
MFVMLSEHDTDISAGIRHNSKFIAMLQNVRFHTLLSVDLQKAEIISLLETEREP